MYSYYKNNKYTYKKCDKVSDYAIIRQALINKKKLHLY